MRRLLVILFVIGSLVFIPCVDAANKARAFTARTGGASGAMDKIAVADLVDGDLGFVVTGTILYVYQFDDDATDAEDDPKFIRPDDYSVDGVWDLVAGYFGGLNILPSAEPGFDLYDLNAGDGHISAKVYANCTDTGSGTEDCDFIIQVQVAGAAAATIFQIDADSTGSGGPTIVRLFGDLDVSGTVSGYTAATEATSERVLTADEMAGGIVRVSFAGEVRLPDVCDTASGAMVMIIQDDASEVVEIAVTDTNDYLFLDGVSLGQNQEIDSPGAAKTDDFIVMACTVAGEWHSFGRAGPWVDGGAAD